MNILGLTLDLPSWLAPLSSPWVALAINMAAWLLIALACHLLLRLLIHRFFSASRTQLDDTLVTIVRRPLMVVILAYGLLSSWRLAFGPSEATAFLTRAYNGILIVVVAYVVWRVLYEIIIAYLHPIVQASDSKADDVIIPILRRIGPVIILVAVINGLVTALGGNLGTLLASLGLLGLVMGYLLQEPLQGLFSGTYIALDNPFREDDLVILEDGTTCQVVNVGLRVTQLYDVSRHVVLFVPNVHLAGSKIINLTKPSVEMRVVLPFVMAPACDRSRIQALLVAVCDGHENVLGDWAQKRPAILRRQAAYQAELADYERTGQPTPHNMIRMGWLRDSVQRLSGELVRLEEEHVLRERAEALSRTLAEMISFCRRAESAGTLASQLAVVRERVSAAMDQFDALIEQITVWLYLVRVIEAEVTVPGFSSPIAGFRERGLLADGRLTLAELAASHAPGAPARPILERADLPRIRSSEAEADKALDRNHFGSRASYRDYRRLYVIWHRNILLVYRSLMQVYQCERLKPEEVGRLTERVRAVEELFGESFLLRVSHWQMPFARLVDATSEQLRYELSFFVDDVVREHFQRSERVTTEVLSEIDRVRCEEGI